MGRVLLAGLADGSYEKDGKEQEPAGHAVGLLTDSLTRPCRTAEMLREA
jgi:hypothetical protein